MVFVIAEPCVSRCDGACVQVCPVECIHGPVEPADLEPLSAEERSAKVRGLQLYIDPAECISCGLCAPECPVDAIYQEDELPEKWRHYGELNADWFAKARRR